MTFSDFIRRIINHKWFPILLITILTVSTYSNIFPNQFTEDENDFIVYWQDTKTWGGLPQLLKGSTPPSHTSVFRPVRGIIYLLMYQGFGENVIAYHVYSLFIHTAVTIMVYLIITQLTKNKSIPLITALLFATHPIHVESIAFIANSFDTFGVFLACLSIYFYLLFRKSKQKWTKSSHYFFSVALATLAFFAYEITVVIPLILLAYELINKNLSIKKLKNLISLHLFFIIDTGYFTIRFFIMQIYGRGEYHAGSILLSILLGIKSVLLYSKLLLLPVNLSLNHIIPNDIHSYSLAQLNESAVLSQRIFQPATLIPVLFIGMLLILVIKLRKKHPILSFAIIWFFTSLLPVMNIIPNSNIFSERYAYFSSIGFCLAIAYLMTVIWKRYKLSSVGMYLILSLVIFFYGYLTIHRNLDWRTEGRIYLQAIEQAPNSFLYFKLGTYYHGKEQYDLALNAYQQAIVLQPDFSLAYYNIGTIYEAQRNFPQAIEYYHRTQALNDSLQNRLTLAAVYNRWAQEYINSQDWAQAAEKLQQAVIYDPENTDYWHNLGSTYAQKQSWAQAQQAYLKALSIDPTRQISKQQLESVTKKI